MGKITGAEVRVGNLLYFTTGQPDDFDEAQEIDAEDIAHIDNSGFSAIPLDEEWLENLHFTKATDGYGGYLSQEIAGPNKGQLRVVNNSWASGIGLAELKFVHQLQNLFYAISGKELKYKQLLPKK